MFGAGHALGLGGSSVVDDEIALREIRVYALNVQSPQPEHASQIVRWLVDTQANVPVLTELSPGQGSGDVVSRLRAEGFTVVQPTLGPVPDALAELLDLIDTWSAVQQHPTRHALTRSTAATRSACRCTTVRPEAWAPASIAAGFCAIG